MTNFPVGYLGKFYKNLAQDNDSSINQKFCSKIAKNAESLSEDVQKYILATSDFAEDMQDDINLYVTCDRLNSASFRQKLNPMVKNIFLRKNPLELVFKDISTFDVQNPIFGLLLRDFDIGKRDAASALIKKSTKY